MAIESPAFVIAKWSIPFAMASSIVGGSAWLTSTHNAVEQNRADLMRVENEFKDHRQRVYDRLDALRADSSKQDERLSRMEEKLDFIVKIIDKGSR
jgi:hypothetical protein